MLVKRLLGSPSVLGYNDPWGVILSCDRTTPRESFCPGIERLQGSHSVLVKRLLGSPSVLGYNDPWESFCPEIERHQGNHSVLGKNDSRGVILFWDRTTPGESFCSNIERLQGSRSVLG